MINGRRSSMLTDIDVGDGQRGDAAAIEASERSRVDRAIDALP